MTFQTQRIAYPYFVIALLLFGLQVTMGLWVGLQYVITVPQAIVDVFPFATSRAMHTNLLVLWLLLGFMGATFYMVPEETRSELAWPRNGTLEAPAPKWGADEERGPQHHSCYTGARLGACQQQPQEGTCKERDLDAEPVGVGQPSIGAGRHPTAPDKRRD